MKSSKHLKHGDMAPDFTLKSTDGKNYSLKDFEDNKAILIVFICNHCPYVLGKLEELNKISEDFKGKGLKVIGINSNESDNYPEDSYENMKRFVESGKVKFLYLHDETQEVAKKYDAKCTPDPFLFDENQKLIFHSRVGFPPTPNKSEKHELYEAIKEFLETGKISQKENPSMGCSIKWK